MQPHLEITDESLAAIEAFAATYAAARAHKRAALYDSRLIMTVENS